MATPNASYGDILSTAIQLLEDEMVDNIINNNGLLYELKSRDSVKSWDGGPAIVQPLEYAENSTYKRYSGYEQLDISPSQVFTAAEYAIKQVAISVSMSGLEMIQNAGESKKFDLMESRLRNLQTTFENNFSTDLYSAGTANSGKQIGGLQLLLADDNTTGTVGGISRATYTFWRHQKQSGVTGVTDIQTNMNQLWLSMVQRKNKPSLIVADNTYFRYYEESLQAIQRITQERGRNKMAEAGFESYLYKNTPVVYDGGLGGACPSNHMYFINGKYLYLRSFRGKMLRELNPDRHAVNQDAVVKLRAWAGALTLSQSRVQGVLIA